MVFKCTSFSYVLLASAPPKVSGQPHPPPRPAAHPGPSACAPPKGRTARAHGSPQADGGGRLGAILPGHWSAATPAAGRPAGPTGHLGRRIARPPAPTPRAGDGTCFGGGGGAGGGGGRGEAIVSFCSPSFSYVLLVLMELCLPLV
jgi:hypothetical protein